MADTQAEVNIRANIEKYKEELYEKLIPDDENGESQTSEPANEYLKTLRDDANLLLRGEDEEREELLSAEAKKYLLPFLTKENTHDEFLEYLSALRINLITFPYTRTVKHARSLQKNGQ